MQTLTLRKDSASLVLVLDKQGGTAALLARSSDEQVQTPRLLIDINAMSVSLLNSSDLGVTVDNNGLATIQRAAVNGALFLQNPATGNWFSYQPDDLGVLVPTPVSGPPV